MLAFDEDNATRILSILAAHQRRIKQAMAARFPAGLYRYNGSSIAWMALLMAVFVIATVVFGIGSGTGLLAWGSSTVVALGIRRSVPRLRAALRDLSVAGEPGGA